MANLAALSGQGAWNRCGASKRNQMMSFVIWTHIIENDRAEVWVALVTKLLSG